MAESRHSTAVVEIYAKILTATPATARNIEIEDGARIQVLEEGAGAPLVMLHGTGAAAHTMLPVADRLSGVHALIPDLPGNGLSDPVESGERSYREMAVAVLEQIIDELGLDQFSLVGSSGGSVWAIWYALANPRRVQRLAFLGSTPLLPGTSPPLPLRLMATPLIGDLMSRMPADEDMVVRIMGMMGESETIVNYPGMLKGLTAANNDPVASRASRREYAAFINLLGFKKEMQLTWQELSKLDMPTLMVWGDHDPLGEPDVARSVSEALPDNRLVLLPAGHVPWLGHPDETARLLQEFLLAA